MSRKSRRRMPLAAVAVLSMTCALLPATAAQGDTVLDARDTASSAPPATVDRPVPGAVPVTGIAMRSLSAAAEPGQTTSYYDQSGIRVYRVDDGYDLDQRQVLAAAKAAGTLDAGTYTSLLAKLDAADASIQRGSTKAADNQLDALLNELSALSSSNISDATRASLTQAVTRLRPRA